MVVPPNGWFISWKIPLLVGGFNPSEKYEFVSWGYEIPNIWKVIQNSMVPVTTNQHGLVISN